MKVHSPADEDMPDYSDGAIQTKKLIPSSAFHKKGLKYRINHESEFVSSRERDSRRPFRERHAPRRLIEEL